MSTKISWSQRILGGMARGIIKAAYRVNGGSNTKSPFAFPAWRDMPDGVKSLIDYLTYADEGYAKNAVVHACIREISRTAPSARLIVQRETVGRPEAYRSHYLHQVLLRPNARQGQKAFLQLFYTYLNLDGNAFVIKEREGKRTARLWLPRPDKMRPVIKDSDLLGFVYQPEGNLPAEPFLPEDVIHVKFPNPADPYDGLGRGISDLQAAADEVDVDNTATAFLRAFFKNAAVPFGLLKSKDELDDAEIKRIRNRIKEQYVGERSWHEIMILDANADYQKMGLDFTEMGFPDLRAMSETRICAAFKVPAILVGIKAGLEASTYSNYGQARRALWEDKLVPDNDLVADDLSNGFADELGPGVLIGFDYMLVPAMQDDRNDRFLRANQGVAGGWLKVNEGRLEAGYPPDPNGDVYIRSLAMVTTKSNTRKQLAAGLTQKSNSWDEERAGRIYKRFDITARAYEAGFQRAAAKQFKEELPGILAIIQGKKSKKDYADITREILGYYDMVSAPAWAALFRPLIESLLGAQAESWGSELGIQWQAVHPETLVFIQSYAFKFAERVAVTSKEAMQALFTQATEEGWGMPKVMQVVNEMYGGWEFTRAEQIARSETIRASNAGAAEGYRQAGITAKQWWATEDGRTCPFCNAMHETIVGVSQNYFNEGDVLTVEIEDDQEILEFYPADDGIWKMIDIQQNNEKRLANLAMGYSDVGYPPLHPNCRCTILPVILED